MPSRLARRAPTTSTRLSLATSAPIEFTIVWVPPVPGSVFTTSDEPDSTSATTCSCSGSASRRRVSVDGGRSSCATGLARSPCSARAACAALLPAIASMSGWSSFRTSAAMAGPTSANDETTRRGATWNHGRCEVRPRSRSMTGCGLNTPFVIASATNASASSVIWNCSRSSRASAGLRNGWPFSLSSKSRP